MRAIRNYQSVDNFTFLHQEDLDEEHKSKEDLRQQDEEAILRKGDNHRLLLLSSGNLRVELATTTTTTTSSPEGRDSEDDLWYFKNNNNNVGGNSRRRYSVDAADNIIMHYPHHHQSGGRNNKYGDRWKSTQSIKSAASGATIDETGSTVKLISPKFQESCRTCLSNVETILCTVAIAAGFGNVYRLPLKALGQEQSTGGGLPFLIAYLILAVIIGLPLLFLELGIGQIVQEGFTKTPRAIPFFKGVAYVKLLAGFLLCLTYPVYMGLSMYYLVWFSKSLPPFNECAEVRMENDGYRPEGISATECLKKTFLTSAFEDPQWFGMYAGFLFVIWVLVMAWCMKRTRVYEKALIIFMLCTMASITAMIVQSFRAFDVGANLSKNLIENIDWNVLTKANVWYCALLQVFLSTNIGFGVFTSNAGIIYRQVNPFKTAFNYLGVNLLIGMLSVILFQSTSSDITSTTMDNSTTIARDEIFLMTHIYDVAVKEEHNEDVQIWALVAFLVILFSGFISMITIMYTMIKGVALEMKNRMRWWQLNALISFAGFILSSASLLLPDLSIAHLLDHYVTGNLILMSVILEVIAFIIFYGPSRLIADFEFIMGSSLSRFWIFMWHLCPLLLISIAVWSICTLTPMDPNADPLWVFILGWSIVLVAVLMVLIFGFYNVSQQEEYLTVFDKLRASFRQARNWGPSDPMMLHNWKQWHSKAQDGERDFTLKRRGTKEYTHSVKNRSKYQNRTPTTRSNSSTLSGSIEFKKNPQDPCGDVIDGTTTTTTMHVTSLIDAITPVHTLQRKTGTITQQHLNPLAYVNSIRVNGYTGGEQDGGSEGYGTYTHRNGPYVIATGGDDHVCHRKIHEQATEL